MRGLPLLLVLALLPMRTGAALTVTDDLGRRLTLPRPPRRIVSLAPSVTEILYAVGAGGAVAADTAYCDYPPAARKLPHVGGWVDASREKIVALRPDLVILSDQTITAARADALAAQWHAPVYVTAAATYAGVERDVTTLGALAGKPGQTGDTLRRMRDAERRVRQAVRGRPRPRVFVVVWEKPLMTAGGGSYLADLIRLAGGVNVAEGIREAYPAFAPERLLREQPDVILMGRRRASLSFPGARALNAVREHRVYAVTSDATDRPGPRLAEGLMDVARALHPEAFRK